MAKLLVDGDEPCKAEKTVRIAGYRHRPSRICWRSISKRRRAGRSPLPFKVKYAQGGGFLHGGC
jgi:hypothetical protein